MQLRKRPVSTGDKAQPSPEGPSHSRPSKPSPEPQKKRHKKEPDSSWGCLNSCIWTIGLMYIFGLFLYVANHSFLPQRKAAEQFTKIWTGKDLPDPPGVRLKKEGLRHFHPVVMVPGVVTGGLELWEGRPCAEDLFRDRIWGGSFGHVYKRPRCWLEHMMLDNKTGLDPPGIRVRSASGLVAADYFMPGYFVWAVLIENLAMLGYDERTLQMASYDWRLSFTNTEVRDRSLSRLKAAVEVLVATNHGQKVIVIPHSMGALFWLHFMKWVETPQPLGGGGGDKWVHNHIHAVLNIGPPFLGVPKAVSSLLSGEMKDTAELRAMAPMWDHLPFGRMTMPHVLRLLRTWDSIGSMFPKGGTNLWGGVDWAPENGYDGCRRNQSGGGGVFEGDRDRMGGTGAGGGNDNSKAKPQLQYGRLIAFGKDATDSEAGKIEGHNPLASDEPGPPVPVNCGDAWTEYQGLSYKAIQDVVRKGIYTTEEAIGLLREMAPKMMARMDKNWAHGLATDLSDRKYQEDPKYWSNPLETSLPNAPEMSVLCLYGVGKLTERSYVYNLAHHNDSCFVPFTIDASANGDADSCLRGGVTLVDGDGTVPLLSNGFMCARGWKEERYNPAGLPTYIREYKHKPPAMLLEGRGTESGDHVDIMGNFALVEDICRVAAGTPVQELGGDRVFSQIKEWSDRAKLD